MARGAKAKTIVNDIILKTFEGSFIYNKEIRVPIEEDGEIIQVKITLTAAKENVIQGQENALPGIAANKSNEINFEDNKESTTIEPTEEEKQNVKDLLASLGL